ncbi:MAG TPA: hypothetical protein VJ817_12035 [Gemmatimonadales bacterium]|nr:hypothetical protein [Gemmatimonadales bacterium]
MTSRTLFLLSPASTSGRRARILLSPHAQFELARRVHSSEGAPIGEVFSFLSGLYFRGKLAYARRFEQFPGAIRIITSDRGLVAPELAVSVADLTAMAACAIDAANSRYTAPFQRDAAGIAASLGPADRVILLGSIATGKYADLLRPVLGDRLAFPSQFVGRGDMSRGGLLLRAMDAGVELEYAAIFSGESRRGKRPPRLEPRK